MGSGKSSVGLALSQRLGWRFEDLDARIEAREGRTIAEIFGDSGEAAFRQAEREELKTLLHEIPHSPMVAALGGGAFAQVENAALLERSGVPVVFLDAPVEELWQRCHASQQERPLRQSENQFRQLYEARRRFYMKAGTRVDTSGRDVDSIAAELALQLGFDHEGKEK
jgi:shikimate kinase